MASFLQWIVSEIITYIWIVDFPAWGKDDWGKKRERKKKKKSQSKQLTNSITQASY